MTTTSVKLDTFLKDHLLTEFLMAQLQLTTYEAMALTSVILGNEQATAVAENTGIPRSKVYGALDCLVQKGLIMKTDKSEYQPLPAAVSSLKEAATATTARYLQFVDMLYSYAVARPTRFAAKIKADVIEVFKKNGFIVQNPVIVESLTRPDALFMRRHVGRITLRERDLLFHLSSGEWKKLASSSKEYLDFIGESTTSGIRVGVTVLTQDKMHIDADFGENFLDLLSVIFNYQNMIVIPSPEIPLSFSKKLEESYSRSRPHPLSSHVIRFFSSEGNYENEVASFLRSIDMHYRDQKDKLLSLEEIKDKTKEQIRSNIVEIDDFLKQGTLPEDYKDVYQDIFLRIKRDLQNYESMALDLEERITLWFRLLEGKEMLDPEGIGQSANEFKEIQKQVVDKSDELKSLEEELYSLPAGLNPYKKFGFLVNPFSLTVPISKPEAIIDEVEPKEMMDRFIKKVLEGSDSNLSFIIAKEGGGKTHFLNFYRSRINEHLFGVAFAIRIQCRPNRDLLDLYPQITTEVVKAMEEKKDEKLNAGITDSLAEAGTPKTIADLMKILRSLSIRISSAGHGPLFILIDEFENALPPSAPGRKYEYIAGESSVIPQAITQLDSLTQLSGVGFIAVFRRDPMWERWKAAVEKRVSKFDRVHTIELVDLSLDDTRNLLQHRLTSTQFRKLTPELDPPTFTDETIKVIWDKTRGNPRGILRESTRLFRRAVAKNAKEVTPDLLEG